MSAKPTSDPRRACLEQLQSDLFLGVKAIPFDPSKLPEPEVRVDFSGATAQQKGQALQGLQAEMLNCQKCSLAQSRTNIVFGQGNPDARLVFVGEAPGRYEDQQGLPFVGRAGKLLDDILTKGMGLAREDVYICNILKCRPPKNRDPEPAEVACCGPVLEQQLRIISPEVICCLGRIAAQCLLETSSPLRELRGEWHDYRGIKTMVSYHPAYLLRNPAEKKKSWADVQKIMAELGLKRPAPR